MMIEHPGFYSLSSSEYESDPCPAPSLRQSLVGILLDQSPRHAWHQHPRLNPAAPGDEGSRRLALGTVAHALLVGGGRDLAIIDAPDYRTNAAKAARDEATASGKTPVLAKDLEQAQALVGAARDQLAEMPECADFVSPDGESEQSAIWQETTEYGSVWCRARLDWRHQARIVDYKTVGRSAHPDALGRHIVDQGYDVQAAWYIRAVETLAPDLAGRVECLFMFQEIDEPYALTVARLDAEGLHVGHAKAEAAIALWGRCLATNIWPSYPREIATLIYPTWALTACADRDARDHFIRQDGGDPFLLLRPWSPLKGRAE